MQVIDQKSRIDIPSTFFKLISLSHRTNFRKDAVKISMDTFIKRFQPENYSKWRSGNDIGPHPEDRPHRSSRSQG